MRSAQAPTSVTGKNAPGPRLIVDLLRAASANRVLTEIRDLRLVATAASQGMSQTEIAASLGVSQPSVHRMLRKLEAAPDLLDRSARELIAETIAGVTTRDAMRDELRSMDLSTGSHPDGPGADGYILGPWTQVVEAWENGWLSEGEYEDLARI